MSLREEALHEALARLPEAERKVLELRYGITDEHHPHTLEQVVGQLGMSRNRVRRLEAEGLVASGAAARDRRDERVGRALSR